ncbi:MAG: hypothetical protein A2Y77_01530 [Planctomycetes bacterium RBG_13_62_9]|nr:MAG: hypothetical protein A2Y77_01530 [Planctomycetes bacterium RBG_13_62_9]
MIEAVCAGEGTTARGHEADPAVLGVDQPLEVHALVVFQRQLRQFRQGPNRVDPDLWPSRPRLGFKIHPRGRGRYIGQIGHGLDALSSRQLVHELGKCVLALTAKDVVEQAGLEDLLGIRQCVHAADHERDLESVPGPLGKSLGVRPLVGYDRESENIGFLLCDVPHELLLGGQRLDFLAKLPESNFVSGPLENRCHVGDAVVEAHLGVRRRVYEEDSHYYWIHCLSK